MHTHTHTHTRTHVSPNRVIFRRTLSTSSATLEPLRFEEDNPPFSTLSTLSTLSSYE
jgi:hypothetical protein